MKRYTLTVPDTDNDGQPLAALHEDLHDELCTRFGGCTVVHADGYWHNDSGQQGTRQRYVETVTIYIIDVPEHGYCATILRSIAGRVKREARQEAVYLTRQDIDTWLI